MDPNNQGIQIIEVILYLFIKYTRTCTRYTLGEAEVQKLLQINHGVDTGRVGEAMTQGPTNLRHEHTTDLRREQVVPV